MCKQPLTTPNGEVVACRRCNECLAARKNDWVNRIVAEGATQPWAGVITLTYDETEISEDGKKTFRYADIRAFLARLRQTAKYADAAERGVPQRHGRRASIRFVVAGERGSKLGRVHWHMVIFSERNLFSLGQWALADEQWKAGIPAAKGASPLFATEPKLNGKTRLIWDRWPFGHVVIDRFDEKSAAYVAKYCLKDMFTPEKSKGTSRETKVSVSAAGMFRMSKHPPLGLDYLVRQVGKWKAGGYVPPDCKVPLPTGRRWVPKDGLKEVFYDGLAQVYDMTARTTGRTPKGWGAMISRLNATEVGQLVADEIMDRAFYYGETEEIRVTETAEGRHAWAERAGDTTATARTHNVCGRVYACDACRAGLGPDARVAEKAYADASRNAYRAAYRKAQADGKDAFPSWDAWHKARFGRNPNCLHAGQGIGTPPPAFSSPSDADAIASEIRGSGYDEASRGTRASEE
jgi:hypothetical protein